jgi:argininosuccinate synthase
MLRAGAVYEGKYLLGSALARPLIAMHQVKAAEAEGCDAVSHGCTGKGNDQVRFELTYKAMNPKLMVIAPWREWGIRSREEAIDYAKKHNVPVSQTKKKIFSNDTNLWHRSSEGGVLEDPWKAPPDEVFSITVPPEKAPDAAETIELEFEKGRPMALNGTPMPPVSLMTSLNKLGYKHGIGVVDMVENRLVGIKSRGVYERGARSSTRLTRDQSPRARRQASLQGDHRHTYAELFTTDSGSASFAWRSTVLWTGPRSIARARCA